LPLIAVDAFSPRLAVMRSRCNRGRYIKATTTTTTTTSTTSTALFSSLMDTSHDLVTSSIELASRTEFEPRLDSSALVRTNRSSGGGW